MTRRYEYATNMGMLYRLTRAKFAAYCAASLVDWVDIGDYGEMIGPVRNVTDWQEADFKDHAK